MLLAFDHAGSGDQNQGTAAAKLGKLNHGNGLAARAAAVYATSPAVEFTRYTRGGCKLAGRCYNLSSLAAVRGGSGSGHGCRMGRHSSTGGRCGGVLRDYDGIVIAPGSPYRSMEGAIDAIRFGRPQRWPLTGN